MAGHGNLRDLRNVQFAQVETDLLRDPSITPQCKTLYSLLITYGPSRIFPGQKTLADALGVSRQTVIRWLGELRDRGLIDWRRREGTSNEYDILGYQGGVTPVVQGVSYPVDRGCNASESRSISPQVDPPKEESPSGDLSGDDLEKTEDSPPRDYLTDVLRQAKKGRRYRSPTIPAAAGGADPYLDGPLTVACTILRITPEALSEKEQQDYAKIIRRIAEKVKGGTPELFVQACKQWFNHGPTWKGKACAPYSNIGSDGFRDDIRTLMRQITSGTIGKESNGWSKTY